ncbi:MAG: thioredoxin domain-containing protein [Alphaproteobacteria bacterium 41-28]|nr:MAG: thioredoxin domain-containing protein [Alphaproteobacteria bacterium 41-28]
MPPSTPHKRNHLARETSPYLQQHAQNPIDWYPWGEEAFEKARRENKPILLSIGYAACHWCHVMAHESFEDEETAKVMNQLFVNIKVDREERPDLDKIYQTAHALLTRRNGGWPLTIFLTPDDLTPFFSGTYFPQEARYQLPSFKDVLYAISHSYQNRIEEIKQQNGELLEILNSKMRKLSDIRMNIQPLELARQALERNYDPVNGGFGGAPKFPSPSPLEFLLQSQSDMARMTLQHMAMGGIYDQLEGGFYRYAVDAKWEIPHFEKMLYDNGQLLLLYAQAAKQFDHPFFAEIAHETATWAIHKLQSPEGGYYSSFDADSEGHEGKFYTWNKGDIKTSLAKEEYDIVRLYFGLDQPPNFEGEWHLHIVEPLESVAKHLQINLAEAKKQLNSAKEKLLAVRIKRTPPHCDTKILTGWNSLMIKGMLTAGEVLKEPTFIKSAQKAISFIQKNLWVNNRLLASYKDGKAHLPAYLDDYVFLLDALITKLQMSWNTDHLLFAIKLADILLKHFSDKESGGFFFTSDDHEKLLFRPKPMTDEAVPSGNGVAVRVLLTLGYLLGESRYLEAAEKTIKSAWPDLSEFPADHCAFLLGLKEYLNPSQIIIIRGPEKEIYAWRDECKSIANYVFAIPEDAKKLPEALALKKFTGKTGAYVCQDLQCSAVIVDLGKLKNQIA